MISVVVPGLSVGDKTVNVNYNGDGKYMPSNASSTFNVGKTTKNIILLVNDINCVESENIIVFVDATGNVTIKLDGVELDTINIVDGKVEYSVIVSKAGEHTVEAVYNGNDDINSTSTKANFTAINADLSLTVEVSDIVYGDVEHIIIKSNAEGKVNVTVNGQTKEYELNTTIILSNLASGKYLVEVTYLGNEIFNAKNVTAEFYVFKADTSIDVEIESCIEIGKTQLINLTLSNENATGEVIIMIDGENYITTLTNGKANFTIPDLNSGKHTITVIYNGNANLTGNWTSTVFEVVKVSSSINVSAQNIVSGEQTKIVISNLPDNATGFVIINVDGNNYIIDINKTKELNILISKPGTYDVVATYLGDDKYNTSNANTTFNVSKEYKDVDIKVNAIVVGGNVVVNLPIDVTGNLTVSIGNEVKTVPAQGGQNIIVFPNLAQGTYAIITTYSGDDIYNSKTVTDIVTVMSSVNVEAELIRAINSPYDYEAEFLNKDGTILVNTDVIFIVNGKTYTVRTDGKGIARLTDSHLGLGTYSVISINPVTGEEVTNKLTIVKRLTNNKNIKMNYWDGTKYVVRVIGDDGKPVGAGEIVLARINGVKYSLKTDSGGYAKFDIKLNPKKYSITVEYKKTKVTNKIIVKQTLKVRFIKIKNNKKLVLKAKLKGSKGKLIKGKKITFIFRYKKYKAKTNKKGIAKVTIKKKVVKRLKPGRKYKYSATFHTNKVKGNVKVKK